MCKKPKKGKKLNMQLRDWWFVVNPLVLHSAFFFWKVGIFSCLLSFFLLDFFWVKSGIKANTFSELETFAKQSHPFSSEQVDSEAEKSATLFFWFPFHKDGENFMQTSPFVVLFIDCFPKPFLRLNWIIFWRISANKSCNVTGDWQPFPFRFDVCR